MGTQAKSRAQRGYLRKLFGGETTAQDVWRQHVIGRHLCNKCSAPATMEGHLFWPCEEFEKDHPALAVQIAQAHHGGIPFVSFRSAGGVKRNFVHLPTIYACPNCSSELEKMLARAPSYVVAEFRRGPGVDKIVSAVPS
jgi:hypothetical protein